jgi:hypothetical protein
VSDDKYERATFQEIVALMGPVITNLSVEPEFFNSALDRLHERFKLKFKNVQKAYTTLDRAMPGIGCYYRRETAGINRKELIRKLSRLFQSTRGTIQAIQVFTGGSTIWKDKRTTFADAPVTYSHFFIDSVPLVHDPYMQPYEVDFELQDVISRLEQISVYAEKLLISLQEVPSKQGQRGLGWYDHFVELMQEAATLLGMSISTRESGSKDQEETAFTAFVLEFESLLPEAARSPSPAACAQRINRSLARLRKSKQK